jgi:hypothetical protein
MVKDHAHGVLQIFKFFGINGLYLLICNLPLFNQREQHISSEILNTQIQLFRYLALFETLVDTSDMLP